MDMVVEVFQLTHSPMSMWVGCIGVISGANVRVWSFTGYDIHAPSVTIAFLGGSMRSSFGTERVAAGAVPFISLRCRTVAHVRTVEYPGL